MPTSGIAKTKRSSDDPMRRVHHEPDAAAHRDAVDQDDDRFGIGLDPPVELIFLAPERQLGVMIAGAAEIVQAADVAAGAKGALARREDDDPIDGAVALPFSRARRRSGAPWSGSARSAPWDD